ncbi:MAG: TonB-dependent receptor [Sphingobacteriia bacterium]|jgi:iron complex outermembrane receptor protein
MKQFIYLIILINISIIGFSQNKSSGTILDSKTKSPLAGAVIKMNGNANIIADKEGKFSFSCEPAKEITVSFIGYESKKTIIKNCNESLEIALIPISNRLEDVEITASSNENKSMLAQPVSITKLGETEIKRGNGLFLDDAINANVPGVTMQRRAVSSGQQFNIRGYGNGIGTTTRPNSNFDGQGYKVYLNGIPITDAEGITVMDDIDFASIGNVEITKGPSGTLYGLAIAGVVNLKTIKPVKNTTSIGQDILIGSYGLRRYTTQFQTSTDKSSLLINYGRQNSDGYMNHTASKKDFVNLSLDYQLNDKASLTVYGGYSKSYDERGGELTLSQYANFDYSGNPEYIKRNAHSEVISFRGGIAHTYAFSKSISNTTTLFGTGTSMNASSAGGWTDKNPINYGLRSTFDMHFQLKGNYFLSGITGIETQRQYAQIIGYNMVANPTDPNAYWNIGAMRSNQSTITGTSSYFTEWTLTMPKDLSITAGLGISDMNIELNDKFYVATNTNPTKFNRSYTGMASPHIAINKIINKHVSVYASYSKGYKAPVSSYFFIPATGKLNTDLKPEIGEQFEIGTKGSVLHDKLVYELAIFNSFFTDKMYAVAVPLSGSTTTTAYSYIANGGKQNNKGIELLLKYSLYQSESGTIKSIRPFANFTYSNFKYEGYQFQKLNTPATTISVADYDGKAVAGVSPVVANAGVDFSLQNGIYGNLNYNYRDAFPITSDGVNNTTSYSLLNAKLGFQHKLGKNISADIFAGVTNITGTQYPFMVFVNQLPDAYMPAPYQANYFGGLNIKYIF